MINVLISLHRGYGLGDAVQMSAVLRHVARYRPEWKVDYQAEPGRHVAGRGIVANIFEYGQPYPSDHYDAEVEILLYDTFSNWHDRPNTRVSSCLHERFGLPWDRECGRYQINVREKARQAVEDELKCLTRRARLVAVHYWGDSDKGNKDLTHEQADMVCSHVISLGRIPLLLDWRRTSPLAARPTVCSTGVLIPQEWQWGRSVEMNCAVIAQCEAFVGIDSGPSKCASATDTPALVTWTGHHPAPFHDPAPNTTHLVPVGYHGLHPVCNDPGVIRWFEANHEVLQYRRDPVDEIKDWLTETLKEGRT